MRPRTTRTPTGRRDGCSPGCTASSQPSTTAARPAHTDLVRLAAQQFRGRPDLETAFLDGYGCDPRDRHAWHRERLREAIGTAVRAYRVGDERFERHGHRMVAEALDAPD